MALTDRVIRTLKPNDKAYRRFDDAGPYLRPPDEAVGDLCN
jgi:hypothetical protein